MPLYIFSSVSLPEDISGLLPFWNSILICFSSFGDVIKYSKWILLRLSPEVHRKESSLVKNEVMLGDLSIGSLKSVDVTLLLVGVFIER